MSSKLIPSKPADVMVIRHVTPNVVTFSVPFLRHGILEIGGRGTVVRLTSGALAVFSPVALTAEAKDKVAELGGDVRYIVALDFEHHIFISEWARAYPSARIVGPQGLPEKRAGQQDDPKIGPEKFDFVFTRDNKRDLVRIGSDEFDADFDYEYVDGHANREIVFLYKPDRVLIQADFLFNLPATEQYSRVPASDRKSPGIVAKVFTSLVTPSETSRWNKRFNWYLVPKDRASFNDSAQLINGWDFDIIIPCHGDVIEGNAKKVFRDAFEWNLEAKI